MTKYTKQEIEETKTFLRSILTPGQKIWGTVVHVSNSGMSRVIQLKIVHNEEIMDISWHAAKLLEGFNEKYWGCKAGGCGMDMVFHLIYCLGYHLYPDGYQCIGEKCVHNSHSNNPYPKKDGKVFHADGLGYVFRQA